VQELNLLKDACRHLLCGRCGDDFEFVTTFPGMMEVPMDVDLLLLGQGLDILKTVLTW
jgi:hypothetical protein